MTDLDERIASVLRERAEGDIDTDRLLSRSRARGRRRQVRRRAATGMALALVGVLGFAAVTAPGLPGLPGRLPWMAATPAIVNAVPPRAGGVPGAAQQPELVGTDPQVLHLGLDTSQARYLSWTVDRSQVESIQFSFEGEQPITVQVARSAQLINQTEIEGFSPRPVQDQLSFNGEIWQQSEPVESLIKNWQPAPGLYARAAMRGGDRRTLARAVYAIRWDEARRCGGPLGLTAQPAGARVVSCSVDAATFPASLTVALAVARDGPSMWVRLEYATQLASSRSESNRTVGGRPAYLYPDGTKLELLGLPKAHLIADFGWPALGFTEADATKLLAGARVSKDLTRPETWE
ncbi:hypothetical protein [Micromonospora sp. NPDC006431]|uniref:hypothetical protein n=1 Tax=Micromonospora sp. NPDC006431 TaxID=3364235 RepID=UPI00367F749E